MALDWFVERLAEEKDVIKGAPLSFVLVVVVVTAILAVVFYWVYGERLAAKDDMIKNYADRLGLSPSSGTGPELSVSENTITPSHLIHHVQPGLIKNITVPSGFNSGVIYLIPEGVITTDTTGNVRNSFAASAGQVILASYDGRKWSLLQSPFAESSAELTTSKAIKAASFETTQKGSGFIELTEESTGHKLIWSVGRNAPAGSCVTGSLYTRSVGGQGSTLYVCESETWIPK
jgi:hypothetical protein